MPNVILSHTVQTKLRQRWLAWLAQGQEVFERRVAELKQTLAMVFPQAECLLPQDVYSGFRQRTDELVLLVEVSEASSEESGPVVVKLGPATELQRELDGWKACRPQGLKHDIVLMDLAPKYDAAGQLIALVYDDAEQLIGVENTMTLEEAMCDAVRLGEPSVASVADLMFQLFQRLNLLLYRFSNDAPPDAWEQTTTGSAERGNETSPPTTAINPAVDLNRIDKHLLENLQKWEEDASDAFKLRSTVTTEVDATTNAKNFRDPVELMRAIGRSPHWRKLVPRMLHGRAHGDLHGRNVLVGKLGARVLWPAVFDYRTMSSENLIARDFVKPEMELKIRLFPQVLSKQNFTQDLLQFEIELFEATEQARQSGQWKLPPAKRSTRWRRLTRLLLQLRRIAMELLSQKGRSQLWLSEYYFALAVYGLNSVRFENLQPIERKGAYLAAGCAAARYLPLGVGEFSAEAPTYLDALEQTRKWRKTSAIDNLTQAEQILREALQMFPYALPLYDELVLVLMEQGRDAESEQLLKDLEQRFHPLSEETLCRLGRFYKKRGDAQAADNAGAAIGSYQQAEIFYRRAYEKWYAFYPRINQLTIRFLRAAQLHLVGDVQQCEAEATDVVRQAEAMLDDPTIWHPRKPDDHVWIPATQGEALLLTGKDNQAAVAYREAIRQAGDDAFYGQCMGDQVRRLSVARATMNRSITGPLTDVDTFFSPTTTSAPTTS